MDYRKRHITIFALIFTGFFLMLQIMRSGDLLESEGSRYSLGYVEESILEKQKKNYDELREDYFKLREDVTGYQKFNLSQLEELELKLYELEDDIKLITEEISK